jgi:alpha-tubulin suppressor-like RCC1 family protein
MNVKNKILCGKTLKILEISFILILLSVKFTKTYAGVFTFELQGIDENICFSGVLNKYRDPNYYKEDVKTRNFQHRRYKVRGYERYAYFSQSCIMGEHCFSIGISQVSAGTLHTCAIKQDGSLWCWGNNEYDQVGDPVNTKIWESDTPIQIMKSGALQVSSGGFHTCVVKQDNSLWCWGSNIYGQLGIASLTNKSSEQPVQVATGVLQVSAGKWHTCAVKTDNSLWCWGNNSFGQLGTGDLINRYSPTQIMTSVSQVSAGDFHTCAVKTDGTLWCWGDNSSGQLGTDDLLTRKSPTQIITLTSVSQVSAGGSHTCAIKGESLWCWGDNSSGQLGIGDLLTRKSPTQIITLTSVSQVSAGGSHTCAVKTDGTLLCWGDNSSGQLGTGDLVNQKSPAQIMSSISYVSAGDSHTCAIKTDGAMFCLGNKRLGRLSIDTCFPAPPPPYPALVTGGVTQAYGGMWHICIIKTDGSLWCWGKNDFGQLGDGTNSDKNTPVQILSGVSSISLGLYHTCAIKNDGSLWCWGKNDFGQLGDGTNSDKNTPVQILSGVSSISLGLYHTCAIKNDGSLWCWGKNNFGQLGTGDTNDRNTPTRIGNDTDWVHVSAGAYHTCALKSSGYLYCWGNNSFGQLGMGDFENRLSPPTIPTLTSVSYVSAGGFHTCAIKNDGSLWCWGNNFYGQSFPGETTASSSFPVQITLGGILTYVSKVAAGYLHTCMLKPDNSLWCWGNNSYGQIGKGEFSARSTQPDQITTGVIQMFAGKLQTCAVKQDNSLWCSGYNPYIKMGIGGEQPSPTRVLIELPTSFSSNARASITFSSIKEAIEYYGGKMKNLEIPTYIITEFFPEAITALGDEIKDKAVVSVMPQSVSIIKESGVDTKCNFPYIAKADITLIIGIWIGKTFYTKVNFQIPITIDILSWWIPPEKSPGRERTLHTGTLVLNFATCDTYIEHRILSSDMLQYSKVSKEKFFGRIKKISSYVIYMYLGVIDYQPLSFLILPSFSVKISKTYYTNLLTTDEEEDAIALEFSEKGSDSIDSQLQITQLPYKIVKADRVKIKVKGSSNTKSISYRLDGGVWSMWIPPTGNAGGQPEFELQVANLLQDSHRLEVIGLTYTGNINEVPQVIDFFVDRSPPEGEIFVKKYSKNLSVQVQAKDNSGDEIILKLIVKDETKSSYESGIKFKDNIDFQEDKFEEGRYKVLAWLEDKVGNTTEVKESEIIIDKTPPQIIPVFLPPEKAKYENLKIVIRMKDNFSQYGGLAYFIEEVVSGRRKTCFSQWGTSQTFEIKEPFGEIEIKGVENEKRYHLCFKVIDPAENESETFETEFIVDITPPQLKILEFPQRITFEKNGKLIILTSDNITPAEKIKIFWDFNPKDAIKSAILQGNTLTIFYENARDGNYRFIAYAIDEAGNQSQTIDAEFVIDTTLLKLGGGSGKVLKCSSFDIRYPLIFVALYAIFIRLILSHKNKKKKNKR